MSIEIIDSFVDKKDYNKVVNVINELEKSQSKKSEIIKNIYDIFQNDIKLIKPGDYLYYRCSDEYTSSGVIGVVFKKIKINDIQIKKKNCFVIFERNTIVTKPNIYYNKYDENNFNSNLWFSIINNNEELTKKFIRTLAGEDFVCFK